MIKYISEFYLIIYLIFFRPDHAPAAWQGGPGGQEGEGEGRVERERERENRGMIISLLPSKPFYRPAGLTAIDNDKI